MNCQIATPRARTATSPGPEISAPIRVRSSRNFATTVQGFDVASKPSSACRSEPSTVTASADGPAMPSIAPSQCNGLPWNQLPYRVAAPGRDMYRAAVRCRGRPCAAAKSCRYLRSNVGLLQLVEGPPIQRRCSWDDLWKSVAGSPKWNGQQQRIRCSAGQRHLRPTNARDPTRAKPAQ
jgi:hypothetical protein